MKIHLLDPGLALRVGHHFDLDLKLARWLAQAGHQVQVYAHAQVAPEVLQAFEPVARVAPLFRASTYYDPRRYDPIAGELVAYLNQSRVLAQDLQSVSAADLWLWPTITAAQLNACATTANNVPVAGCVHTEARAPLHPHGDMWWRHALLAAHRAGMNLRLGALEEEMRFDYQPLMEQGVFQCWPHYFDGIAPAGPRQQLRRIGFFGHQRSEKGAALIPALVKALAERGFDVVVQDSLQHFGLGSGPRVTVLGFVDDLAEAVSACDLVVLPYDPESYRRKASGILLDALASGVPVVAPFGTLPGRWIDKTGAGTQFMRAEAAHILQAIELAQNNFGTIAKAAAQTAVDWRGRFGVAQFARALLG